jgi:putative SOS response-associated peptidase YedK
MTERVDDMCGRFTLTYNNLDQLVSILGVPTEELTAVGYQSRFNIAPLQEHFVLREDEGERHLLQARWGLVNSWAKDNSNASRMINARAETLAERPAFRSAFKRHRCIIPADGFYEWTGEKKARRPLRFHKPDGSPLLLAGLYEFWQRSPEFWEPTFTIITTSANDFMSSVHDRMPVIIPDEALDDWLASEQDDPIALRALLQPAPDDLLVATPASTRVNSARTEGPECLVADEEDGNPGKNPRML